ncbi:unnamed protein product [Spirodela intermedia]|uniref:Hexosyltransferase n=1 Tax=Spirodela intermedia TaxID=51605 RepID=A0A7I8I810_SPIIN|nr:unnamed protein product [Spirodela intermedia]CAA6653533.1 unnamed protein product [Spirodela intermedia]
MQIRLSPSMRSLTIATSNGFLDLMKVRVAARHISYRTLFHTILILAFLLPFVFILTAVVTLEGVNKCSTFDCLGRRLGPKFLTRSDDSVVLIKDFYHILNQVNSEEIPDGLNLPESFDEFLSEIKGNHAIPKGIHCLSLRLTDEYSSNAHARKQLPAPELLPLLFDNSCQHFVLASDNILAASVVVASTIRSSLRPEKLSSMSSPIRLVDKENVPVLEAIESHHVVRNHYHGNHIVGTNAGDSPRVFASKLQARSPKYISLLNHLRIYLPEVNSAVPETEQVVFLDDDVVIQRDLSPLWEIDLSGTVNGAVETCRGGDIWVMSKRFRTYFNFSHPLIAQHLDPDECAWAYGMNIFDLSAWRKTDIRDTYHYWLKENLKSNLTLWKFGTLPPALIAFRGHVHPIDPSWHMLGLGYQENTDLDSARRAAVIHYNGQGKPWLDIGFKHLRPFWSKYVNYSDGFIRSCHILEPQN